MYHQGQHLQASYNRYKSQTTNLEEHLFPSLGTSVSYRRCGSWLTFPKQRSVFIHSFLESGVTFFWVRPHNLEYIITISGASLVLNIHILASFSFTNSILFSVSIGTTSPWVSITYGLMARTWSPTGCYPACSVVPSHMDYGLCFLDSQWMHWFWSVSIGLSIMTLKPSIAYRTTLVNTFWLYSSSSFSGWKWESVPIWWPKTALFDWSSGHNPACSITNGTTLVLTI